MLLLQVKAMKEDEQPDAATSAGRQPGSRVVLDWKGDPMTINPGDKMPF